jgi:hypothetical protein
MEFKKLAQSVLELDQLLDQLRTLADSCGVPSPEHQDWYALLKHKLVPQLSEKAFLLVAVMGGTNTGKSLIFNHLVGGSVSAVDFRASGTKHPVCLVPKTEGTQSLESLLARQFDSFKLIPWERADQPLELTETNCLFWTEGTNVPEQLLLLDTPDIDSDHKVNWDRARAIRHAADVLIAVLTEQKYNDAAVRQFFREAAEAEKPIIVLFNMFDIDNDAEQLPRWLEQIEAETRVKPIAVLAAPFDRERSEKLELPFYEYRDGKFEPADLHKTLTELHFDTIKTQALLGAVKVLDDPQNGVQSYLDAVQKTSSRFAEALQTLKHLDETNVDWPGLPMAVLAEEIRAWWDAGRPGWSQNINSVYRKIGTNLLWSFKKAKDFVVRSEPTITKPMEEFQTAENSAVREFVEKVIRRLEYLSETENPVLRGEILGLIGGENRSALLRRAHSILDSLEPVDDEFRNVLRKDLTYWSATKPTAIAWLRSLDSVITAARPLITVAFAGGGFDVGIHLAGQMIGEVAIAGGVTAAGEAGLQAGSEGIKKSLAKLFKKIQEDYVLARSERFYTEFQKELWHDVITRLQAGAAVMESNVFRRCKNWNL